MLLSSISTVTNGCGDRCFPWHCQLTFLLGKDTGSYPITKPCIPPVGLPGWKVQADISGVNLGLLIWAVDIHKNVIPKFLFVFVLGSYLVVLRGYFWLYAQKFLLAVLRGSHVVPGVEINLNTCKTGAFFPGLPFQLTLSFLFCIRECEFILTSKVG